MPNELRFDGKVVVITGAGNGLGRSHALLFGSRGAKVVVNDLGGNAFGTGKSSAAADEVVEEIKAKGGEAVASYDSVEDGDKIVQTALDSFGRIDIVVNNAGILRDTTFHKMTQEDWDLIYRVHVLGSFRVSHAAWPHMRDQGHGRIVMTASAAGIYGNFGQANYSMAKLGLLGLSNTLALEGKKRGVHVNTIAPLAGSRLTETVLPKELIDALKPEYVSPLVAWLCHESCGETGGLFEVGGGFFAKLRWERSAGKTFRTGRAISIEDVAGSAKAITSFDGATHPENITASMQPVMENIQAGPSRGGNQYIDVDEALGYELPPQKNAYDERDLALYALGVGAAANPLDDGELRYVYELHKDGFVPLPTYAVIPALNAMLSLAKQGVQAPGLRYGLDRLLHGEQYTELRRPLPPSAKLEHKIKVKDIFDKGRHAIVVTEVRTFDESGDELAYNEITTLIRGAGGWGGDRGPTAEVNVPPDRAPDAVVEEKIDDNQALLYRLSGDWNPLHADPAFATAFGFKRPILHGLCTFGYAGRHVIQKFFGGDPRKFKSIRVRFADSVFPGETLVTEMWKDGEHKVVVRCKVKERDKVVLSNAAVEIWDRIPEKKAPPKPAATAASAPAATSAEPTSADVFAGIAAYVTKNPELAGKVGVVYLFKLTSPDGAWTLDLKNGKGAVTAGAPASADCTLELSDADFMAMCTGKADPQKLYFGGKLKISGNVMASQKLELLKKIDPNDVIAAMQKRTGGGGAPAAAPAAEAASTKAAPAAPKGPSAKSIFNKLATRFAESPKLASELGAVVRFKITGAGDFVVDGTGAGAVRSEGDATTTVTLDEEALAALAGGESPERLHQTGRMRVDGDVRVAARLGFMKGLA